MQPAVAAQLLERHYPRIFFACHRRHVRDPDSGREFSAHAVSILDHLDEHEPTFVSALAEHMGVTPSTTSLALNRLEAAGLVQRLRDQDDARRVGVILTPAGHRLRSASSVLDPDLVLRLVSLLTDEQRASAIHGLGLLANAAQLLSSLPSSPISSPAPDPAPTASP